MKLSAYWWQDTSLKREPRNLPSEADVVIIGGGFTGLSAGLAMLRAGRSVVIIDKGQPGMGASTRNGGICSGNIRLSHGRLESLGGKDYADALYAEGAEARSDLAKFIKEEKIDCDYSEVGWCIGALSPRDYEKQQREAELLNTIDGIEIETLPQDRMNEVIGSSRFYGGMLRPKIGAFHPGKFFGGLLKIVEKEGGILCPETAVETIEDNPPAKEVITTRGSIIGKQVIIATNGYTGREHRFSRFLRRRLVPVRSAIITTELLGKKRIREFFPKLTSFSTTANLAAYFRPTPDGERILFGARGFDTETPSQRTIAYLRANLASIFPDLNNTKIEYCWQGNVAYTKTQLPAIFEAEGIYYSAGYAGSGTVWARWLGKKIAEHASGTSNQASSFYSKPPPQIPFYDGNPWFMPLVSGYYAIKDMVNEKRFHP